MNRLQGTTCLVTGGAGFIGSHIADQLFEAGAKEVRILDNFTRGSWINLADVKGRAGLEVTEGNVCDPALVNRLVRGCDYVFHQAALRITHCAKDPREATDVLIGGTLNVLEAAREHNVKKVIAASSASVYGESSYLPMDEAHPFNNDTLYGGYKIANEQMLRAFFTSYGLNYAAFRYFNVYGPRMDLVGVYTEVMIRWLDAIEAGTPPKIFGDGSQSMDFVHVVDVARANIAAAQSSATNEVFNVGTGIRTSLKQLCDTMLEVMGSSLQPVHEAPRQVGNVLARQAAVDKAEKLLGFRAKLTLAQGLRDLIEWRKAVKAGLVETVQA